MVIKAIVPVVVFLLWSGLGAVAMSGELEQFPILPGAIEKPCGDDEAGICRESPVLRFEIRSAEKPGTMVKKMLLLSRKKGWKMNRVTGTPEPRYQSTNGKKFDLLWAVEKAGRDKGLRGRDETVYHIFYWKVYGD
jgi:hypothetical protein